MTLDELKTRIQNGERVPANIVSGIQIFMLLRDKIIETIKYNSYLYEMNFVPAHEDINILRHIAYHITEESYPDVDSFNIWFKSFITFGTETNDTIFINLEGEYYEIILEVVESP